MFTAYELQADFSREKRLALSSFMGLALLASLASAAVIISARPSTSSKDKTVDVSFRPPPPPPPPAKIDNPPPPPPKRVNVPRPAGPVVDVPAAAPVAAAAAMVAPTEAPKSAAPESNTAVAAINVAVGGKGDGSGTAVGVPSTPGDDDSPAPVEVKAGATGPVNLPEEADPPEPDEDNAPPEYPEAMRSTGQEARVVLKIVVQKDGTVGKIQVLKGDEPFVANAIAAVKTWKFTPAMLDGQPIAVFMTIPLKYSLRE